MFRATIAVARKRKPKRNPIQGAIFLNPHRILLNYTFGASSKLVRGVTENRELAPVNSNSAMISFRHLDWFEVPLPRQCVEINISDAANLNVIQGEVASKKYSAFPALKITVG